jgi:hypothetical protein
MMATLSLNNIALSRPGIGALKLTPKSFRRGALASHDASGPDCRRGQVLRRFPPRASTAED